MANPRSCPVDSSILHSICTTASAGSAPAPERAPSIASPSHDYLLPETPVDLVFFDFFAGGVGAAAVSVDEGAGALGAGASSPDVAAVLAPAFRSDYDIDYWDFREDVEGFEKFFARHEDEFIGQPRQKNEIQTLFFPLRNETGRIMAAVTTTRLSSR